MLPDSTPKSKSLLGMTELTLVATIKDGLIPALDARSYASRAALVMKTLNTLRQSSREAEPTPLIQDAVDRMGAIHSFRLSLLGVPPRQLMLSVTFDGGWEPYMRRIWRDLGPLLDLIFCNCRDYLTSHDHSYADYIGWVRSVQVNTDFFYTAGAQTVGDIHYLRKRETERIDGAARPQPAESAGLWRKQALPAITALYRLSDMYPRWLPEERGLLERAARRLLGDAAFGAATKINGVTATETEALSWFKDITSAAPMAATGDNLSMDKVQGGILQNYDSITHGCLLLVELDDARAAQRLLAYGISQIASGVETAVRMDPYLNLAFTYSGLVMAGLPEGLLRQLPQEFREGMAARAGLLGDWRHNHPLRWRLPARNGPSAGSDSGDRVECASVHAVLHLQGSYPRETAWSDDPVRNRKHPLALHIQRLSDALEAMGAHIVSVQAMQRLTPHPEPARGHFNFVDGISQPSLGSLATPQYSDTVLPGDLLLGLPNSMGDPPQAGPLWSHSSFLVVRKLRQDVAAFHAALTDAVARPNAPNVDDAKALLMGRTPAGKNLISNRDDNDFNYAIDPKGAVCPFQSHVRRANPRTDPMTAAGPAPAGSGMRDDLKRVPRILRRGLSYGPTIDQEPSEVERGLVFMAYNASIAEQFEVVQAWLAGGNSASRDTWSGQRDPFLGVPLDDEPLDFVFNRVTTDGKPEALRVRQQAERPWVRLEWGMYLFVPSMPALRELQQHAETAAATEAALNNGMAPESDRQRVKDRQGALNGKLAAMGAVLIKQLRKLEEEQGFEVAKTQWKLTLEDIGARSSGATQALWAAIRDLHGGVLRTPYGVLVGGKEQVLQLFANTDKNLTATGYLERMEASFGKIYLGLDAGEEYVRQSTDTNKAIQAIGRARAYASAYRHTTDFVVDLLASATPDTEIAMEVKDLADAVLAKLGTEYFGLPDETHVKSGGWHWREVDFARCPAHFHAPSRYMFQPQPGEQVASIGKQHGQLLEPAVKNYVAASRSAAARPSAPIARAILGSMSDNTEATRNLMGALMGFLPTVDGNLRAVLFEWVSDRSLWDLQSALFRAGGATAAPPLQKIEALLLDPLARTMQLRPVPELTWRRAVRQHTVGGVAVQPGETVVVGIVSALHEDLLHDRRLPAGDPNGRRDLSPVFGGIRDGSTSAPTHACPGYEMAIGVLLGILAGLMLNARLRATLNGLTLRLAARAPAQPPTPPTPPSTDTSAP